MYQCINCGMLFDEPKRYEEKHGLDYLPYEIWYCCPYCGGDYLPEEEIEPKKYARFLETLTSPDYDTIFLKDQRYEVTYESDSVYHLGMQNGHKVGIDKASEGIRFVIEVEE